MNYYVNHIIHNTAKKKITIDWQLAVIIKPIILFRRISGGSNISSMEFGV